MALVPFALFFFGLAIGSFLNVVIFRYDGERPLFSPTALGGRSRCPSCARNIAWYDLVPVLSFIALGGRCRGCRRAISFRYPFVELITAAAFVLPALYFYPLYSFPVAYPYAALMAGTWLLIIALMIVVSGVDMRLMLIPDEAVLGLAAAGIAISSYEGSFLGAYQALFPVFSNPFLAHFAGGLFGAALLGSIVAVSRGRAMGMGDVKLAGVMGLILGFPDIVFALALSFLAGGIWSIGLLAVRWGRRGATMKTMVPFGPFMVAGFFAHIFYMERLMAWYFSLL